MEISDLLDKEIKILKRKRLHTILGTIFGISAYVLCFVFFSWKLALIIFLVEFSRNLGVK